MTKVFVIAQGGGPTAVINQTVAGAVIAARQRHPGARILGARHGVRGIRDGNFIDLSEISEADLRRMGATPNAALGSTRDKPDAAYCARILEQLQAVKADAFIYIGGNDTAGTQQILNASGGGMAFIHAPKTIDNDLVENDHTPGFISAALFVSHAFLSMDLDFRALPGVYVGIVMGRHAGFLTAAAAAWRRVESDGPHLVYVPERAFSTSQFLNDVRAVREKFGRCVVAMSEGVATADGRPLVESLIGGALERDAHGNVQLSTSDLGLAIQTELSKAFPKVRARVDTFGYLPRAFSGTASEVDRQEAYDVGAHAVAATESGSCSIALGDENGGSTTRSVPLAAVAGKTRLMPKDFLDPSANRVSEAGVAYFSRLLPPPPDTYSPFL